MRVDLHMHSIASDGVLSPSDLMELSYRNACDIVSLTDHDTFAGCEEACAASKRLGMKFISGIEISSKYADKTIHIVGLGLDYASPVINEFFVDSGDKRSRRAVMMDEKFQSFGIYGAMQGALKYSVGLENLSRTHFAKFLFNEGYVETYEEAFTKYLKDGGPCYIPTDWPSVEEVVNFINQYGGVAVLAHPGRYKFQSEWMMEELLKSFKSFGGTAIEVSSGSQPQSTNKYFADVARRYNFLASTGSDFHNSGSVRPAPGLQEQIPKDLTGVWTLF